MTTIGLRLSVHGIAYAVNRDNTIVDSGLLRLITKPDDINEHVAGRNPPGRVERRLKRAARRNQARKVRRIAQVRTWIKHNLGVDVDAVDPGTATTAILHREKAITEPLTSGQLAVVLLTAAKRRGWKRSSTDDEDDLGEFLANVERNTDEAAQAGGIGAYQARILRSGKRVRTRTYFRELHEAEFVRMAQVQCAAHPCMQGEPMQRLRRIMFFQRPLKSNKASVGKCAYEPDRRVCNRMDPWFQTLRVYLETENLRVYDPFGNDIPVKKQDLHAMRMHLMAGKNLTPLRILKLVGLGKDEASINCEKGIQGHLTRQSIPGSDAIIDDGDLHAVWQVLHSVQEPEARMKGITKLTGISNTADWAAVKLPKLGYAQYSQKAVKNLLQHLTAGKDLQTARKLCGYDKANSDAGVELRGMNLVQQKWMDHLRLLVAKLEGQHGRAERIVLASESMLTASLKKRSRMAREKRAEDKVLKQLEQEVAETLGPRRLSGKDKQRLLLWKECGGISPLEPDRPITLRDLLDGSGDDAVTVDHIVPFSRLFDDGPGNKVLTRRSTNKAKGDLTGLEFIRKQGRDEEAYVNLLDELKLPLPKRWKLKTHQENIPRDYVSRGLPRGSFVRATKAAFGAERTLWCPLSVPRHLSNRWDSMSRKAHLGNHVLEATANTQVNPDYLKGLDTLTDHPGESLRHLDPPADWQREPAVRLHHYRRSSFRGKGGRMEPKVSLHRETHYGTIARDTWVDKKAVKGAEVLEERGDLRKVRSKEVVVRYPVQGLAAKDTKYIVDEAVRKAVEAHLAKYAGSAEKAWANYEEDPPLFAGCAIRHVRLFTGLAKVRHIRKGQYLVQESILDHLAVYAGADGHLGFVAHSPMDVADRRRAGQPATPHLHPEKGELVRVVRYGDVFTLEGELHFVNTIDGDSGRVGLLPVWTAGKEAKNVSLRKVLEPETVVA